MEETLEENGRRKLEWWFTGGLEHGIVDRIMDKMNTIKTCFYMRYGVKYDLGLIHKYYNRIMPFEKYIGGGVPEAITSSEQARRWLETKDMERLSLEHLDRPNTEWTFHR